MKSYYKFFFVIFLGLNISSSFAVTAVSIFTLDEWSVEGGPELIDGDLSSLGFRIDPDAGGVISSVAIKGFPENTNDSVSDWIIPPNAQVFDQDANYEVIFVGGPTQLPDDTWEVIVDVTEALPGEEVSFFLTVTPMHNFDTSVPLLVETTISNSSGTVISSKLASVGISFVPLPSALILFFSGLLGLAGLNWRK